MNDSRRVAGHLSPQTIARPFRPRNSTFGENFFRLVLRTFVDI
jgi:hypothetical protein